MLNILIAIVSRVFEAGRANYDTEFLRAKAELICEIEAGYFLDHSDPVLFPQVREGGGGEDDDENEEEEEREGEEDVKMPV
jgi:hypothetical protein